MTNERKQYFTNLDYEQKLTLNYDDFTASELIEIVQEMKCRDECKDIIIMYYIKCLTLEEIANELNVDYRTIANRLKKLKLQFNMTCIKLFFKG